VNFRDSARLDSARLGLAQPSTPCDYNPNKNRLFNITKSKLRIQVQNGSSVAATRLKAGLEAGAGCVSRLGWLSRSRPLGRFLWSASAGRCSRSFTSKRSP
jgi:hypothetical protein